MNTPIIDLGEWLEQPAGSYIRSWEQKQFDQMTANIFGYHALQIGLPQINALSANRMPYQWHSDNASRRSHKKNSTAISLVHSFAELPFESQSLDLVILPHILEFSEEPHQVLREVERVLIPEGRAIICGFNRRSLWGARQKIRRNFLPESGEYISPARLRDWLKLLNMEIDQTRFCGYALPVKNEKWLNKTSHLENLGARWWASFGAVYMIQAVKRVRGMHLVGPAISRKEIKKAHTVPVTNKENNKG